MENTSSYFLNSSTDAANFIEQILLSRGLRIERYYAHRNPMGTHVELIDKDTKITYHIKFARQPFNAFGFFFPQYKGEKGETLDEKVLDKLSKKDVLLFAYPDKILMCTVEEFIKPNLWRETRNGVKTCSFPIDNLEVFA